MHYLLSAIFFAQWCNYDMLRKKNPQSLDLSGIKQFRRQLTKEEKLNAEMGAMAEEVLDDNIDDSDVNKLKDDLGEQYNKINDIKDDLFVYLNNIRIT